MSSIYDSLNPAQQEAVRHTEGPLLILAGAGSGKTRVLTHRIAYLIDECGVNPWNIFAITFTNKAAREMRERVDGLLGSGGQDVWVSTFHSACVRILRRYIDRLGYDRNFTIYDTDDQKTVVREVIKGMGLDTKVFKERPILSHISHAKDKMMSPQAFAAKAGHDIYMKKIADIYKGYQERLKANNALDFDDLLCKTVELFRQDQEALNYYQERFRYIMVDEYQDTNAVQFMFVSMIAEKYRNLCVVGDDDQSIYKFRGADIRNILDFEDVFPDAGVIRLEENYRSTKNILDAANGVIHHNIARKDKTLWTEKGEGSKIIFRVYPTEHEEASAIVRDIAGKKKSTNSYGDFAVLYRTNAQARVLEESFVLSGIPYRVFGGVNFYQRKEIKDILAYMKTVDSGLDNLAVSRIINVPKRGIGTTTLGRAMEYARDNGISLFDALSSADTIEGLGRAAGKMKAFVQMIDSLRVQKAAVSLTELFDRIMDESGYAEAIAAEGTDEAQTRLENLDELRNKIVEYEKGAQNPSLTELLEQIALVADVDNMGEDEDRVILMTLHSAKGLEFPHVYMAGMEEGLFPSYMSINSEDSDEEIEEERRLCYVGITRAMDTLMMTCARQRMIHGNFQMNQVSRFIKEIPNRLLDMGTSAVSKTHAAGGGYTGRGVSGGERRSFAGKGSGKNYANPYSKTKKRSDFSAFAVKGSDMGKTKPDYSVGDTVRHVKFGKGIVKDISDAGKDYQVTVEFERFGVKKMLAGFAKLKKL